MKEAGAPSASMRPEALAGGLAGVLTRFVFSPLDVLKIRFQNQVGNRHKAKYRGVGQALRAIFREEGIQGLWRGSASGMMLWGVYSSVQFPVYRELKRQFDRRICQDPVEEKRTFIKLAETFFCGGVAACLAQSLAYPLDTLRTRIISAHKGDIYHSSSLRSSFMHIAKTEGVGGFFAGLRATMLQVAPNSALTFMFYDNFSLLPGFTNFQENAVSYLLRGACSGLLAKVVTYPLDTVKKRMQLNGSISSVPLYQNSLDCAKRIYLTEGIKAFYKGLVPQIWKTGLSSATTFYLFEMINNFLQKQHL